MPARLVLATVLAVLGCGKPVHVLRTCKAVGGRLFVVAGGRLLRVVL